MPLKKGGEMYALTKMIYEKWLAHIDNGRVRRGGAPLRRRP